MPDFVKGFAAIAEAIDPDASAPPNLAVILKQIPGPAKMSSSSRMIASNAYPSPGRSPTWWTCGMTTLLGKGGVRIQDRTLAVDQEAVKGRMRP
ncbi:MAG TPA: hypothetical protein VIY69_06255 [Candidatus Acidoferrales bacterium]